MTMLKTNKNFATNIKFVTEKVFYNKGFNKHRFMLDW